MMGTQPAVKAAKSRAGLKNRDRRTSVHGNVWSRGLALQLSTKRNTDATFDRSAPFLPITLPFSSPMLSPEPQFYDNRF